MSTFGKIGARDLVWKPPYDKEVEYLQTSGTQCIDTGLHVVAGLGFDAYWGIPATAGSWQQFYPYGWSNDWCGSPERAFDIRFKVDGSPNAIIFAIGDGRTALQTISTNYSKGVLYHFVYDAVSNVVTFNGVSKANPATLTYAIDARNVRTMRLGGTLNNNNFSGDKILVGNTKFYMFGSLIHDFTPVRVGSVGYMFDRANIKGGPLGNGLYPNAGTGSFILGSDIP